MKTLLYTLFIAYFLSSQPFVAQVTGQPLQTYTLRFQTTVNGSSFSFDSVYQNQWNETYKVRSFKYYVSHIRLVYNNGKIVASPLSPHLVNEADSNSQQIAFSAPKGIITGIQFLLGIDSVTNVSGVQSGDLDPARGMFWIWNTGYIMAKLEGSSSSSKAPGKQYSYDIGGYKPGENVAKEIGLSLAVSSQQSAVSQQPDVSGQRSAISYQLPEAKHKLPTRNRQSPPTTNHQPSTFLITADIAKWFYGKYDIKISEQAMCHSPGAFAMQVADNYAAMFSLSVQ